MGDRLIIYGSGSDILGRYVANKDINSAAIVQNSKKLLINGQIQTFNQSVAFWQFIPQSSNVLRYQKHDRTWVDLPYLSYSIVNRTGYSEFIADLSVAYSDPLGKSILSRPGMPYTIFAWGDGGYSSIAQCDPVYATIDGWATRFIEPAIGLSLKGQVRFFLGHELRSRFYGRANIFSSSGFTARFIDIDYRDNSGTCFVHVYIEGNHTRLRVQRLDGSFIEFADFISYQEITQSSCILRVTLENGTTQDLNYQVCPTVERMPGCEIAITFADGTSRQIPVNPSPTWVQKKPENSCPDGTIHQCQHGATVCCYACQNGRLTLVEKFNAINN